VVRGDTPEQVGVPVDGKIVVGWILLGVRRQAAAISAP
jgi:hypothetical protein